MRLDGHPELPGEGVPGDNRIGMTRQLARNAWLFAKPHGAFFTSSGETERRDLSRWTKLRPLAILALARAAFDLKRPWAGGRHHAVWGVDRNYDRRNLQNLHPDGLGRLEIAYFQVGLQLEESNNA